MGEVVRGSRAACRLVSDGLDERPLLVEIAPTRFTTGSGARVYLHTARAVSSLPEGLTAPPVPAGALQNQKLEVLGRLAAGVAHDFNNLLSVILNYVEWVKREIPEEDPMAADLEEVLGAARRATALTRSLLAFGRAGPSKPLILDVNEAIRSIETLMQKSVGERIAIVSYLGDVIWNVLMDPSHLDQVLMNLCVNARDAMPDGGGIVIETRNVVVDSGFGARSTGLEPGAYVQISVSDSGAGIPEALRSRVFEPFFTTKARGEGTGLGLATVYGVVRQAGGQVHLYSEVGEGTTFKVYLPAREDNPSGVFAAPQGEGRALGGRGERVLLVEDDEQVRDMTARFLTKAGYRVIQAEHGDAAIFALGATAAPVDLVIADIMLPGMTGVEMVRILRMRRPGLPAVYLSGYARGRLLERGILAPEDPFVSKPYSVDELFAACRRELDRVAGAGR